jgi:3-hydroxyisobutyrate dehydrogenase-like beta-hydroxyacid dehydrogenase
MNMPIGFIGLGKMGGPMARRLMAAGHDLVVADVNAETLTAFETDGAIVAKTPREVADRCEIVLASLPTPAIVQAIATGTDGVGDGALVRCFVDLSTTGARMTTSIAEALGPKNVAMVDAPVSGGVAGASAGTLAMMVAAPDALFAELEPILKELGKVFHVGTTPGLGQTMKLVNNYLSATALVVTAEAMAVGAKAGLDPATMIAVINAGSGRNSASQDKFPRAILPRTFDFGFSNGLMCKDLKLFVDEAEASGAPLWVASIVRQVWQHALTHIGPDADFTTVVQPIEQWAGVQFGRHQ